MQQLHTGWVYRCQPSARVSLEGVAVSQSSHNLEIWEAYQEVSPALGQNRTKFLGTGLEAGTMGTGLELDWATNLVLQVWSGV